MKSTNQSSRNPALKRIIGVALAGASVLGVAASAVAVSNAVAPRPEVSKTDASAQPPAVLVSVTPVRVLDTRPGSGPIGVPTAKKVGQGEQLDLKLAGEGLTIPANASAAIINVTIDEDATLPSFLTVWPTGEPRPNTSVNNALPGSVSANSVIAKLGNGSISIFNQQGSVHIAIDLVGYLTPLSDIESLGTSILTGAGAPNGTNGEDGDFYIDTNTNTLYGPKTNGAYPTPGIPLGAGPTGPAGPAGTSSATLGGSGLLGSGTPTVLGTTDWTDVATFTTPRAGSYILQANAGITFENDALVAVGVASTTLCRWSNNTAFDLGASISAGVLTVPGLDTANISVPGYVADAPAGQIVTFECMVDQVLAINSRTAIETAITAIQVTEISNVPLT